MGAVYPYSTAGQKVNCFGIILFLIHIKGVPEKVSHFKNETSKKKIEIWNQKAQFSCFWNA